MKPYEIQKWTRILNHPNSTAEQKAEAQKHLDGKDEPALEVAPTETYNATMDAELEFYLTTPRPPRHERPEGYWPPQSSLAGRVYRHLTTFGILGYTDAMSAMSIAILIPVMDSTKSRLIARESARNIRNLLNSNYPVPEPLRAQANAALAKYQDRFPENGQVEVTDGR